MVQQPSTSTLVLPCSSTMNQSLRSPPSGCCPHEENNGLHLPLSSKSSETACTAHRANTSTTNLARESRARRMRSSQNQQSSFVAEQEESHADYSAERRKETPVSTGRIVAQRIHELEAKKGIESHQSSPSKQTAGIHRPHSRRTILEKSRRERGTSDSSEERIRKGSGDNPSGTGHKPYCSSIEVLEKFEELEAPNLRNSLHSSLRSTNNALECKFMNDDSPSLRSDGRKMSPFRRRKDIAEKVSRSKVEAVNFPAVTAMERPFDFSEEHQETEITRRRQKQTTSEISKQSRECGKAHLESSQLKQAAKPTKHDEGVGDAETNESVAPRIGDRRRLMLTRQRNNTKTGPTLQVALTSKQFSPPISPSDGSHDLNNDCGNEQRAPQTVESSTSSLIKTTLIASPNRRKRLQSIAAARRATNVVCDTSPPNTLRTISSEAVENPQSQSNVILGNRRFVHTLSAESQDPSFHNSSDDDDKEINFSQDPVTIVANLSSLATVHSPAGTYISSSLPGSERGLESKLNNGNRSSQLLSDKRLPDNDGIMTRQDQSRTVTTQPVSFAENQAFAVFAQAPSGRNGCHNRAPQKQEFPPTSHSEATNMTKVVPKPRCYPLQENTHAADYSALQKNDLQPDIPQNQFQRASGFSDSKTVTQASTVISSRSGQSLAVTSVLGPGTSLDYNELRHASSHRREIKYDGQGVVDYSTISDDHQNHSRMQRRQKRWQQHTEHCGRSNDGYSADRTASSNGASSASQRQSERLSHSEVESNFSVSTASTVLTASTFPTHPYGTLTSLAQHSSEFTPAPPPTEAFSLSGTNPIVTNRDGDYDYHDEDDDNTQFNSVNMTTNPTMTNLNDDDATTRISDVETTKSLISYSSPRTSHFSSSENTLQDLVNGRLDCSIQAVSPGHTPSAQNDNRNAGASFIWESPEQLTDGRKLEACHGLDSIDGEAGSSRMPHLKKPKLQLTSCNASYDSDNENSTTVSYGGEEDGSITAGSWTGRMRARHAAEVKTHERGYGLSKKNILARNSREIGDDHSESNSTAPSQRGRMYQVASDRQTGNSFDSKKRGSSSEGVEEGSIKDNTMFKAAVGLSAAAAIGAVVLGPVGLLVGAASMCIGVGVMQIPEEQRNNVSNRAQAACHRMQESAQAANDFVASSCAVAFDQVGLEGQTEWCNAQKIGSKVEQAGAFDRDNRSIGTTAGKKGRGWDPCAQPRRLGTGNLAADMGEMIVGAGQAPQHFIHADRGSRPNSNTGSRVSTGDRRVACLRKGRITPVSQIHALDPSLQPRAWLDVMANVSTSREEKNEALEEILILARDKNHARMLIDEGILDSLMWILRSFFKRYSTILHSSENQHLKDPAFVHAKLAANCCVALGKAHCAVVHTEGDLLLMSSYSRGAVPVQRQLAQLLYEVPHSISMLKSDTANDLGDTKDVFALADMSMQQAEEIAKSITALTEGRIDIRLT